ncbi:hypothetical protein RHGRI_002515 [Rhododendron griersonianum]|uniref:Replication protein A 70 kDa DNA-binding subunit B/D first OB fold domain-containing protein n=1 Tax=Rhododendron griersonianum TaxID=479676 RepID=A0AAV6LPR7_9ERIC|nr:hypothetical protein RHGRI_002515 [Rhododendron griersonianum]
MQKFPKFFHPSVLASPHGVAAIYSGILVYYVRIDNHELTLGWYDIVADHKFGGDYTILLASVGHLLFDLYIFDEEGCQVKYPWTTTAAINHPNTPPNWDPIEAQSYATGCAIFTGCMPSAFRSMGHELRFHKKLTNGDLVALELCQSVKQFAKELEMNTFMLVARQRIWEIQHIAGYLVGHAAQMASNVKMLKDMVTGDSNWTAEVMVIEKGFPRLTEKNRLYQKLVFIDSEGTKIQGTIFQEDMSVLKDTLKIYHTYTISNAVVNDTPPKHRVIDNDHQWLLYGRTPIEEVEVKSLSIRALKYNFIPLTDLGEHTNSREGIDAIFAVLKVGTPKRTKETWVQNILIIDQGCRFQIQLSDSTGYIIATAFGEQADSMFSITGDYLRNNMHEGILSDPAKEKLATGIEYAVHLRAYKYAPRDVELCLFSIHTFTAVTEIIDDQDDFQLLLLQTPSPKKQRLDETEAQTSVPIPKASTPAMQTAEPTEPFAPKVHPLPTTMESDATTEPSESDPMEDTIAASKNPRKHRTLKNKKD